jgi:ribonuclease VapC
MSELPVYILDSFALLAHFQDEHGQGRVVTLLEQAQRGECRLLLSLINLGEMAYLVERRRGLPAAQSALAALQALPIEVLPADTDAVFGAAHLKARFPIAFADAFAAQAAVDHQATLVTGDPEFQALEGLLEIEWLAR